MICTYGFLHISKAVALQQGIELQLHPSQQCRPFIHQTSVQLHQTRACREIQVKINGAAA